MSVRKELPFEQVNALALGQYPDLLFKWFPAGKLVDGKKEFAVGDLSGSASHKKTGEGSVKVNIRTGKWAEMNGKEPSGGDPISLYAWAFCGGDMGRACKMLGAELGVPGCTPPRGADVVQFPVKNPPRKADPEEWRPLPVPENPEPPNLKGWDHVFTYRGRDGRVERYVMRNEARDGKRKTFSPLTYGYLKNEKFPQGKTGWHWKAPDAPRSLYGLERLDGRPFILQEGEIKTDRVAELLPGYACLSLTGGTGGEKCNDLAPLAGLAGFLVPDADSDGGGLKAMRYVAGELERLGASVMIVDTASHGFPDKWDLGDAVKDGWTADRIEAFLKDNARPFIAGPDPGNVDQGDDGPEWDSDDPTGRRDKRTLPPLPLGHDRGIYYYLSPMTGQVVALTPGNHTKLNLMALADKVQFWERGPFNPGDKIAWDDAAADLMAKCAQIGPYNPDRIRGRGAWLDEGRPILHMGQRLMVRGETRALMLEGSRFVYEEALAMDQAVSEPIGPAAASELLEICKLLRWEKSISATLMAGWLVVAPICGALRWRPSIWVSGGSGSGKSTLETRIVRPVLGGLGRRVQGGTTEAGIRQLLGMDARPVVFDEAEAENAHAKARIQAILDLVRQSSSEGGAEIVKGTQGQAGVKRYHIRSCFLFSSINVTLDHLADESRVTVLELRNPPKGDAQAMADYDALLARIEASITPEFCAGLLARSVLLMETILKNAATFARAVATHLGSSRVGDQIGTLLAGAYALTSNREIDAAEALEWVKAKDWGETTSAEAEPDERRMLSHLMQTRIKLDTGAKTEDLGLAEVVRMAAGENGDAVAALACAELRRHGMAWDAGRRGLWISNGHKALKGHLTGTPWSSQWARTLRRLPGAEALGRDAAPIRFVGSRDRATLIPLDLID